jgi:hypothetical protein
MVNQIIVVDSEDALQISLQNWRHLHPNMDKKFNKQNENNGF